LLKIPNRDFTLKGFRDFLIERESHAKDLKVYNLWTKFDQWGARDEPYSLAAKFAARQFNLTLHGEIMEITAFRGPEEEYDDNPVKYYAHLYENGILQVYTFAESKQADKILADVVGESGIYYLWLGPPSIDKLRKIILSSRPSARLMIFAGKRSRFSALPSNIRPNHNRTINYIGSDADEALEELRSAYGVIPIALRFQVSGSVDFWVDSHGTFTFLSGKLAHLFDFVETAIELAREAKRAVENTKLEKVSTPQSQGKYSSLRVVPLQVNLTKELSAKEGDVLVEQLTNNNFMVYNKTVTHGSFRMEATVVDTKKKTFFSLGVLQDRIVILPRDETQFDSFLRLISTLEEFDPDLSFAPMEGP